jgi:hypothetical protein
MIYLNLPKYKMFYNKSTEIFNHGNVELDNHLREENLEAFWKIIPQHASDSLKS